MSTAEPMPIACALGPAEMAPRLARIRQLTQVHLRSHRLEGSTLRLTYHGTAAAEVEQIVALERECCAFLDFNLGRAGDDVELVIVGPERAGSDAKWLFSQFLPEAQVEAQAQGCSCCKG